MLIITVPSLPSPSLPLPPLPPPPSGYLFITGRIKELLITRGGENVAPVPIEERMLDQMKLLSRCMVVGDNQKYLAMLVALRTEVGVAMGGCGQQNLIKRRS